jgi:hypothetical protein
MLVSTKTGEPIEGVSQGDPGAASLSLAERILGPLGAQWFYEASVIGRSMWIPDQDLMLTVQTNGTDNLGDAVNAIYDIVKRPKAD